jgi:hypothetical protein
VGKASRYIRQVMKAEESEESKDPKWGETDMK